MNYVFLHTKDSVRKHFQVKTWVSSIHFTAYSYNTPSNTTRTLSLQF